MTDYLISAAMSYDMRHGTLQQPNTKHNNPEDYGMTRKEEVNARVRYLRSLRSGILEGFQFIKKEMMLNSNWWTEETFLERQKELDDVDKQIKFQLNRLNYTEDKAPVYDLAEIKKVPCDRITEINNAGFFINNPFRNETSHPSNSLHWNKHTNRWTDYGSGEHGDNLDLYMKINDCDFKTALRELSNM